MPSLAVPWVHQNFEVDANMTNLAGGHSVTGGALRGTTVSGDNLVAMADTGMFSTRDQYTELAVKTLTTSQIGAVTRATGSGTFSGGYLLQADSTANQLLLFTINGGTGTQLNFVSLTFTVPFTIRLESVGDSHYCYYNGSLQFRHTDTIGTANTGVPAAYIFTATLANAEVESFVAGPLPPGFQPGMREANDANPYGPIRRPVRMR